MWQKKKFANLVIFLKLIMVHNKTRSETTINVPFLSLTHSLSDSQTLASRCYNFEIRKHYVFAKEPLIYSQIALVLYASDFNIPSQHSPTFSPHCLYPSYHYPLPLAPQPLYYYPNPPTPLHLPLNLLR